MANCKEVNTALQLAKSNDCLAFGLVLGVDEHNRLQLFTGDADIERIILLLERAKSQFVRQLEAQLNSL